MIKGLSIALLVIGVILIIYGVSASESVSSEISRVFTGSPTEKTIYLLVGGIACAGMGLFGILKGGK